MTTDADRIRDDIESTRAELSADVDALTDHISPGRVAQRQADRVRTTVGGWRERVMGSASDVRSSTGGRFSSLGDGASGRLSSLGETASDLPDQARQRVEGSPLAVGLIAFGAGLLAAALLPSTTAEQRAATSLKEQAQPLVDEAKQVAQDVAQGLKEPAAQAASAVKDRAAEGTSNVKESGAAAVSDVKEQATGAAEEVRGTAGQQGGSTTSY